MLAVERDIKPRNMTFAKVERRGASNRKEAFIRTSTVITLSLVYPKRTCNFLYFGI